MVSDGYRRGYVSFAHFLLYSNIKLCFHWFLVSDEKDPQLHGKNNSHILRTNMPNKHRRGISPDRTHSLAIDDRIPVRPERPLTKVNSEKPKFTIRKPYIDREVRDKKAHSETWVPSYV